MGLRGDYISRSLLSSMGYIFKKDEKNAIFLKKSIDE
jgi:hypothetical protein